MLQIPTQRKPFLAQKWEQFLTLTTPPAPQAGASFAERDRARRARAAATLLGIFVFMIFFSTINYAIQKNFIYAGAALLLDLTGVLLLFLNSKGWTPFIGALFITASVGATIGLLMTKHGGMTINDLSLLDDMIVSVIIGGLLLPFNSIFIIAILDIVIDVLVIRYAPQSLELKIFLKTSYGTVLSHILVLDLEVTTISYLWGRGLIGEIKRADKAEEIAKLERTLASQQQAAIVEKEQLDAAIQDIVQTHVEIANGNYNARVPIGNNVLWSVTGALNNLLNRVQGWRQDAQELQRMRQALYSTTQQVQLARRANKPLQFEQTGTALDTLLLELQYNQLHNAKSSQPSQPSQSAQPSQSFTYPQTDPLSQPSAPSKAETYPQQNFNGSPYRY